MDRNRSMEKNARFIVQMKPSETNKETHMEVEVIDVTETDSTKGSIFDYKIPNIQSKNIKTVTIIRRRCSTRS